MTTALLGQHHHPQPESGRAGKQAELTTSAVRGEASLAILLAIS